MTVIDKLLLAAVIVVLSPFFCHASSHPPLIPEPVEYYVADGTFKLPRKLVVDGEARHVAQVVEYLHHAGFDAGKGKAATVHVTVDKNMSDEQYRLEISREMINIYAASKCGFMYAVETFSQLADAGKREEVNACTINDYPRFGYRGLMIDVVRCYYTIEDLCLMIDMASRLKINNVHLHLTDDNGWRVEIKKYPKLTSVGAWRVERHELFPGRMNARSAGEKATYGGFYTQKQLRYLVKYASERNINIIPEIEMPAHAAAAIASYPELACSVVDKFVGVFPGIGGRDASIILCAGKEHTYEFITDVLDELMDVFPSEYIHIGGDEAEKSVWRRCPDCNALIEKERLSGYEGLQAYLMDRVSAYVRSKGRVAMGWDEATYGNPHDDMVIMGWQGDGNLAVDDSRLSGRKFIMTPAKALYLIRYQGPQWFEPFTYFGNNNLRVVYDYEPFGADWDDNLKSNLLGVQASMWSEFCHSAADLQYMVFPRLLALADVGWRPEDRNDWSGFLKAVDNFTETFDRCGINYARSMYNISHRVIPAGGKLRVELSCIRPDVEIRYSVNDAEMKQYSVFSEPIEFETPVSIFASTFKDGRQVGRTLELDLQKNKATGCHVSTKLCRNGLLYTLTNGLRGSDRCSDSEWAGWRNETAEFTVDLGSLQKITSVGLGAVAHSDICVVAPHEIQVYSSPDGESFNHMNTITIDDDTAFHKSALKFDLDLWSGESMARYVKIIALNPGIIPDGLAREGSETWMYFDEIIVN